MIYNFDSNGRILTSGDAIANHVGGIPFDASGNVVVSDGTSAPNHYQNGFPFDSSGALAIEGGAAITNYQNGFPFSANSRLVTDESGAIESYLAGLPYSASGLSMLGGSFNPNSIDGLQAWALSTAPYYYSAPLDGYEILAPKETHDSMRTPRKGRAYLFDGVNDNGASSINVLNGATQFTFCAWVRLDNAGNFPVIVGGAIARVELRYSSTTQLLQFTSHAPSNWQVTAPSAQPLGVWTHCAGTFNNGAVALYSNGVQVTTASVSSSTPDQVAPVIGARGAGQVLPGAIRDVRIYNVEKTPAQIAAIHAGDYNNPDRVGLVSAYACSEESGVFGYDWSGNGNRLTLNNITPSTFHTTDTAITDNQANTLGHTTALSGNTTDVYALRNGMASTLFSDSWTIAFELYNVPASGTFYILNRGPTSPIFAVINNKLAVGTGSGWRECNFSSGSWVVTYDTLQTGFDRVSLYKDGVLQTMTNNTTWTNIPSDSTVVNIFRRTSGLSYMNGVMPRIRMWSGVKTISEVAANNSTGMVFDLQEFSQNTWLDSSTNKNHFTVLGTNPVVVIPRNESNTALDALGGPIKYQGKGPLPMVVETPCITGNGTDVRADLTSIVLTGDFDISIRVSFNTTSNQPLIGNNPTGTNGGIFLNSNVNSRVYVNGTTLTFSHPAVVAGAWYTYRATRVSNTVRLFINGVESSTGGLSASGNFTVNQLLRASTVGFGDCQLCDLQILDNTTGITTYFPLQDGQGSSNTNRNLSYIGSDGTYGVVTNAIINGTVANIWANRCPGYAQDWCVNYGGTLAANGSFVPATLDSSICADGGAVTLSAGKFGNPYSRLNANPFTAAEYNGRSIPTAYAPAGSWNSVIAPTDTGFRRTASDGDDRFLIYSDTLTGADLTNVQTYTS